MVKDTANEKKKNKKLVQDTADADQDEVEINSKYLFIPTKFFGFPIVIKIISVFMLQLTRGHGSEWTKVIVCHLFMGKS